jgi:hypothetical protein
MKRRDPSVIYVLKAAARSTRVATMLGGPDRKVSAR